MEAVLLNSGGADALASILKLREADDNLILHSLYVDLKQDNTYRASKAASIIAKEYCVSHKVFGFRQEMTTVNFSDPTARQVMPYLNIFLHILGAIKARQLNVERLVTGVDNYLSGNFANKFASLLAEDHWAPYQVIPIHPVKDLTREERLLYIKDNPLANSTVSCNEAVVCNTCIKCKARLSFGLLAN